MYGTLQRDTSSSAKGTLQLRGVEVNPRGISARISESTDVERRCWSDKSLPISNSLNKLSILMRKAACSRSIPQGSHHIISNRYRATILWFFFCSSCCICFPTKTFHANSGPKLLSSHLDETFYTQILALGVSTKLRSGRSLKQGLRQ